ncbi:MAG TPA: hypothetical protein VGN95_05300 [Pyrinomonadaceae bacterium]|nr:hypothetical protein [Pyrinomonadaceae bacterium]
MSSKLITRWEEQQERDRITAYADAQVLEPESIYPGWTNMASQCSVREIAIAPKSRHIWMATWGGVLSWRQREESTYYRYASEQGLAGNSVSCICVDEVERPWAGHEEGGLSYFDGQRWQVYAHLQTESIRAVSDAGSGGGIWVAAARAVYHIPGPESLPVHVAVNEEGAANALALLADGDELLLGNSYGLFRLRRGSQPLHLSAEANYCCVALARDGQGRIWLGTPEAVHLLEQGAKLGAPLYDGSAGRVVRIAAGKARTWMLTDSRLCQVTENGWQPIPLDVNQPSAPTPLTIAASLSDNYLWVGTDRILSGLYYEEQGQVRWDHDLLPLHAEDKLSNLGRCISSSSNNGTTWIGTAGGLITCSTDNSWTIDTTQGDVRSLCVARLGPHAEEQETLWMLAWPKGISPLHASEPPAGLPVALAAGQDGSSAYALTSRGLYHLGGAEKLIAEDVPWSAHCLAQTPDGVWWVGTTEGMYQYGAGGWRLANERPGPLLEEIRAIAVINAALWVVTEAGLWTRRGGRWESHSLQNDRRIWAIAGAGDMGKLWLAHDDGVLRYDSGACRIDREYTPARNGLASRRVTALVESNGILWIATQAGISILKLRDEGENSHE